MGIGLSRCRLLGPIVRDVPGCMRAMMLLVVLIALPLSFPVQAQQVQLYRVSDIATKHSSESGRRYFGDLQATFQRLQAAAGTNATLYLSPPSVVNAFATINGGQDIVVVYGGLLSFLGSDHDAIAAVLAHELGHVKYGHVRQGQQADAAIRIVTSLAGLAFDIHEAKKGKQQFVGLGRQGAELGHVLLTRAFTRDQEREADRASVDYLTSANIDPESAVRLQETFLRRGGSGQLSIFATHPSTEERVSNLKLAAAEVRPRYEAHLKAIEAAEASRYREEQARVAASAQKAAEQANERAALHSDTSHGLQARQQTTRTEEAFALRDGAAAGKTKQPASDPRSAEGERCQDQSATRRTCIEQDAAGRTIIKKCEKQGEQWQCRTI